MTKDAILCRACGAAEIAPRDCAQYFAGCEGCAARALAHGPAFFEAAQAHVLTGSYRAALQSSFGSSVSLSEAHALVKAWADRIEAARLKARP